MQKQPSRGVPRKRCSENMQQICKAILLKLRHGCSPVYLLHIFRTTFLKSTSGRLLLKRLSSKQTKYSRGLKSSLEKSELCKLFACSFYLTEENHSDFQIHVCLYFFHFWEFLRVCWLGTNRCQCDDFVDLRQINLP